MVASVKAAREVGATRFAAAFGNDPSVAALVQAGRIALREGRPADAATHYMAALAKDPLPRLALAAFEALLRAEGAGMAALADRLEGKFVGVMPAIAPAFQKLRRVVGDERASKRCRPSSRAALTLATSARAGAESESLSSVNAIFKSKLVSAA